MMKSQITNGGVLLLICESTNSHKSCFYNMLTITSEIVIGGWFVACLLFHLDTFRGRAVTLRSLIYLTCIYIFVLRSTYHMWLWKGFSFCSVVKDMRKKVRITTYRASGTFPLPQTFVSSSGIAHHMRVYVRHYQYKTESYTVPRERVKRKDGPHGSGKGKLCLAPFACSLS